MAEGAPSTGANDTPDLFAGVFFAVVSSPELSTEQEQDAVSKLTSNGAVHCELSSDLVGLTHIISATSHFPAYTDAVDGFLHVVKPQWIHQSLLRKKQANTRQYSPDPSLFMSNFTITFANDIPDGDKDAIVGGLLAMGGHYSQPLTKLVTHVIALSMENEICQTAKEKNLRCKILLPHWFDDCLKLGRGLDTAPYELPDPGILRLESSVQIKSSQDLDPEPRLPENPNGSTRKCDVFQGHAIKLDADLGIGTHLRDTLTAIIISGGGTVVSNLKDAEILICQYRAGQNYKTASREGKEVGSVQWLYYLINYNRWISPCQRLLHYPIPKNGIPGFQKLEICVSNYTGMARTYLESLVKAAGGIFTKTLSNANTHLITAHTQSEKCDAAQEWNINIVNHLWLEESYAKCRIQAISKKPYTTFPSKTNLTQVVGQTPIDRKKVREYFFPDLDVPDSLDTTTPAEALSDQNKQVDSSGSVDLLPSSHSRSAKARAVSKLQKMAPDVALYEKEMKRVGGVIHGGRRVNDPDRINLKPRASPSKRARDEEDEEEDDDEAISEDELPTKKVKTEHVKPLRVFITGGPETCSRAKTDKLSAINGVSVIYEESGLDGGVDVLVASRMLRTVKFLAAIASGASIVTPAWVDHVISKKGNDLSTQEFALTDTAFEEAHKVNLATALRRAKENKGELLQGWTIFCATLATGAFKRWKQIVEANGGELVEYKGRATKAPPFVRRRIAGPERTWSQGLDDTKDRVPEYFDLEEQKHDQCPMKRLWLIADQDQAGTGKWQKFRELADSAGYKPCIVKTEWIMRVALTQSLDEWSDDLEWPTD